MESLNSALIIEKVRSEIILESHGHSYWFDTFSNYVLSNEDFLNAPAAVKHHHAYKGGLHQHTSEVVYFSYQMGLEVSKHTSVDLPLLFIAALWHDFGKIYDYDWSSDSKIECTQHRYTIGHIVRGYHELNVLQNSLPEYRKIPEDKMEKLSHCILSHHGKLEWGSPVTPHYVEAELLHRADMMSVYVNNLFCNSIPGQ